MEGMEAAAWWLGGAAYPDGQRWLTTRIEENTEHQSGSQGPAEAKQDWPGKRGAGASSAEPSDATGERKSGTEMRGEDGRDVSDRRHEMRDSRAMDDARERKHAADLSARSPVPGRPRTVGRRGLQAPCELPIFRFRTSFYRL